MSEKFSEDSIFSNDINSLRRVLKSDSTNSIPLESESKRRAVLRHFSTEDIKPWLFFLVKVFNSFSRTCLGRHDELKPGVS